jgi:hypothetical protein
LRNSRRWVIACGILAAVALLNGLIRQELSQIHGAWVLYEASFATEDRTTTNKAPQPGLVLFTKRHYSLMYVEGSAPRALFQDPLRPTDAEKLAAFQSFVGHSGTYTLVDDSNIQMRPLVAKNPTLTSTQRGASFARFAYEVTADTLRLVRRGRAEVFTMKLVKAE